MKSRILHILGPPHNSSAGKQLGLMAQGMPRDDFDMQICILGDIDGRHNGDAAGILPGLCSTSVPVTIVSRRWIYDPRSLWKLKHLIDRFQPNLIHAWTPNANLYALAAAKATGVTRFVASYGCVDPFKSGPRLLVDRYIGKYCGE